MADSTLDLAYAAVMSSYDHITDRMNALNAQMDQWFLIALSFVPLVPLTILASGQSAEIDCVLIIAGASIACVGVAYFVARLRGRAVPLSPSVLTKAEWLDLPVETFQREMISWRGEHFDALSTAVDWKRNTTYVMFVGIAVEVIALAAWAVQQIS